MLLLLDVEREAKAAEVRWFADAARRYESAEGASVTLIPLWRPASGSCAAAGEGLVAGWKASARPQQTSCCQD